MSGIRPRDNDPTVPGMGLLEERTGYVDYRDGLTLVRELQKGASLPTATSPCRRRKGPANHPAPTALPVQEETELSLQLLNTFSQRVVELDMMHETFEFDDRTKSIINTEVYDALNIALSALEGGILPADIIEKIITNARMALYRSMNRFAKNLAAICNQRLQNLKVNSQDKRAKELRSLINEICLAIPVCQKRRNPQRHQYTSQELVKMALAAEDLLKQLQPA